MATLNQTHVHDLTTLANFKDWAQSISLALASFGWLQTSDTGQVNWSTISSVPASNAYVYEIWQPGDGLTAFYVRLDYGNNGGTPGIRIQSGTGTNGAGTLTGFTTTQRTINYANSNDGATLYNCLYSGNSGSFQMIMWRDGANFAMGIERSRDSSGNPTSAYWTQYATRTNMNNAGSASTQSVVFGVGKSVEGGANANTPFYCLMGPGNVYNGQQSILFNGQSGVSPVFPYIGYYDIPGLSFCHPCSNDFSELAVISFTILGSSHTYIVSKNNNFSFFGGVCLGMRWE